MNHILLLAILLFPQLSLGQVEVPAIVRTTIPSGDATGGKVDYTIPLGDTNALRIRVDAGKLSVAVSGSVKDQFALFTLVDGEYVPLECSAGFLGVFTGTVTCAGIEPGMRLVFVRKDFVDALVPAVAGEVFAEEGEEGVFDEEEFFGDEEFAGEEESSVEEDESFFAIGGGDLTIFGTESETFFEENLFSDFGDLVFGGADEAFDDEEFAGEAFGDEVFVADEFGGFGFETEDFTFGVASEDEFGIGADEEFRPEFGVDFGDLTFGGEDEAFDFSEAAPDEFGGFDDFETEDFTFGAGEEFGAVFDEGGFTAEDFTFGVTGEDEFGIGADEIGGEAFAVDAEFGAGEADEMFGEEFGEEFAEEERGVFRRAWEEVKVVAIAVQYKVADVIARFYVKEAPLSPEAKEVEASADEQGIFDAAPEEFFFEDDEILPTDEVETAPAATVNEAFQRFINGLEQ